MLACILYQSLPIVMTERRLVDPLPVNHVVDVDVGGP